ncbi:MAG: ATPase [Clostridiales bacterium]|nr:ATPase [Clostridiales bacterium]
MSQTQAHRDCISAGRAALGIELGSTRIKAVLIDEHHQPIATGSHQWENSFEAGYWTYGLDEALQGVALAYQALCEQVRERLGLPITRLAGIGVSAMMHGYLVFDQAGRQLVPFRTWRNTTTAQAAEELSALFDFAIPQRWSIAHLYQAVLNGEEHVPHIRFLTTLAGYVHWRLTGSKTLGVGDASGVFPLDDALGYDQRRVDLFENLIKDRKLPWKLRDLLPDFVGAGEQAGSLTQEGARLLDPTGQLQPGIPFCPPEGDAGTGMVATNAVAPRTGNVSAGTSIFAMIVLEKSLSRPHPEIDIVTTPAGHPVAMVHCNNCTTDLNTWVNMLADFLRAYGQEPAVDKVYQTFFEAALNGEAEAGGLLTCGYYSGEHITGFEEGRPFLVQTPDSRFSFNNLARSILFSALTTLKIGMKALEGEQVSIERVTGHGGLYRHGQAGQRFTAAALNTPVSVMDTANEGGAWGIAILAMYMANKQPGQALGDYLNQQVFHGMTASTLQPDPADVAGFTAYLERFTAGLEVEEAAVRHLK